MKNFLVLSRIEAEQFVGSTPYGMISYGNIDQELPLFENDAYRRSMIRLELCDTDVPNFCTRAHDAIVAQHRSFDNQDAKHILDFVEEHDNLDFFVIHCEAGVSRSRGTALALATIYGDPEFHTRNGYANLLIATTILEEYHHRSSKNLVVPACWEDKVHCPIHVDQRIYTYYDADAGCALCGEKPITSHVQRTWPNY